MSYEEFSAMTVEEQLKIATVVDEIQAEQICIKEKWQEKTLNILRKIGWPTVPIRVGENIIVIRTK